MFKKDDDWRCNVAGFQGWSQTFQWDSMFQPPLHQKDTHDSTYSSSFKWHALFQKFQEASSHNFVRINQVLSLFLKKDNCTFRHFVITHCAHSSNSANFVSMLAQTWPVNLVVASWKQSAWSQDSSSAQLSVHVHTLSGTNLSKAFDKLMTRDRRQVC